MKPASGADPPAFEERLDPRRPHPLWGEHRARYRWAGSLARGLRVLDAACGNGYGACMLEQAGARAVVGVDLSAEAVAMGRALRPAGSRVSLLRADLARLPFPAASFDLVASFESIEHVDRPEETVREFARVLAPGGALLVSSPNGAFYPGGHSGNPFHHVEYDPEGLRRLVAPHFRAVTVHGQRLRRTSPGVLDYGSASPGRYEPPVSGLRALRRSLFAKLPLPLKDVIWRAVRGVPYYPREDEFDFTTDDAGAYPVIVALCRRD